MIYSVKQIFASVQGEGALVGTPAVFVRLAGCNLWSGRPGDRERDASKSTAMCSKWCDTDFTDGIKMSQSEILDKSPRLPLAVITGGEPMLQCPQALIAELRLASYRVAMETNGTIEVPTLLVDWLTVSPKHLDDRWVQRTGSELKIVYPAIDPGDALAQCSPDGFAHLFVQPEDGPRRAENQRATVDYVLRHPRWRISAQMHKFLELP